MYKYEYQYSNNLIPNEWAWKKNIDNINYPQPETAVLYRHCRTLNEDNQIIEESITSVLNLYSIGKDSQGHLIESPNTPLNIYKHPKGQIKLLMIGSSFCYYYVEELRALAEEYGIDLIVANLYSSGHTVQEYSGEVSTPKKIHQLFITDANGRREITSENNKYSLEEALKHENWNWDIISLQNYYNNEKIINSDQYNSDAECAQIVYNYCKQFHPKARYLWNQTWAHDIGFPKWSNYDSIRKQNEAFQNIELCAAAVKNLCGVEIVPSGTAWQYARQNNEIISFSQPSISFEPPDILEPGEYKGEVLEINKEINSYHIKLIEKYNENQDKYEAIKEQEFSINLELSNQELVNQVWLPRINETLLITINSPLEGINGELLTPFHYIAPFSELEWGLCQKLNASNKIVSDQYHDGDIGGGQYLNACTWFMTLFKISCIGSTWAPSYTLSKDKRTILQQAAYKAVTTK